MRRAFDIAVIVLAIGWFLVAHLRVIPPDAPPRPDRLIAIVGTDPADVNLATFYSECDWNGCTRWEQVYGYDTASTAAMHQVTEYRHNEFQVKQLPDAAWPPFLGKRVDDRSQPPVMRE